MISPAQGGGQIGGRIASLQSAEDRQARGGRAQSRFGGVSLLSKKNLFFGNFAHFSEICRIIVIWSTEKERGCLVNSEIDLPACAAGCAVVRGGFVVCGECTSLPAVRICESR